MQSPLLPLLLLALLAISAHADCYTEWSRCTPSTSFATGILWKGCADYCRQCKGKASGRCVKGNFGACSGGYQCQCSGGNIKASDNWIVQATCNLGL